MSNRKQLLEHRSLVYEDKREDGAFKVRIIDEGMGSSGYYSAELLKEYHSAFDNCLSFKNHPEYGDPSQRDFTMISGRILGETWIETQEGKVGVYGWFLPDPEYADKLERYKDVLGLSIFIEGEGRFDENGMYRIEWLNKSDEYASVDVVIAPGRGGRLAVESLKKMYTEHREEESGMELTNKDVLAKLDELAGALNRLVAADEGKAAEAAQVEADAEAVKAAVEAYDARMKQIDEANLDPVQVEELRAVARRGEDVTARVESAKALLKSIRESLGTPETPPSGQVVENGNTEGYTLKAFKESK